MAKDDPKSLYKKTNPQNEKLDNLPVACSNCFTDIGLQLEAKKIGTQDTLVCKNCESNTGHKLSRNDLRNLANQFFVSGTCSKPPSETPMIQFSEHQKTDIQNLKRLRLDILLFEKFLDVGFFWNTPQPWEIGINWPLMSFQHSNSQDLILSQILELHRSVTVARETNLYRVRRNPVESSNPNEYDSPPSNICRDHGRLDSPDLATLYASSDLSVCLHECRVTSEDELYFATLILNQDLKFLDLTHQIKEPPETTEFESINLAIDMLFRAGTPSYPITRSIALAAQNANYDGLIYSPCFKAIHSNIPLGQTVDSAPKPISPKLNPYEYISCNARNLAIFGHPIQDGKIGVKCINSICLNSISYGVDFGPVLPPITDFEAWEDLVSDMGKYMTRYMTQPNRDQKLEFVEEGKKLVERIRGLLQSSSYSTL